MKKLNSMEMRNVEGGKLYYCFTCSKKGKFIGTGSFTVGWHCLFSHGGRKITVKSLW